MSISFYDFDSLFICTCIFSKSSREICSATAHPLCGNTLCIFLQLVLPDIIVSFYYFQDPMFWTYRPLSEMMIRAAADDVRFLLCIYYKMMEKLNERSLWYLAVRGALYSRCFCINENNYADWPDIPPIPGFMFYQPIHSALLLVSQSSWNRVTNSVDLVCMPCCF